MIRRIWIGIAVSLAALSSACGGESGGSSFGPTSVATTAVNFRLDSNSCSRVFGTQTLNIGFFIDGLQVGSANLGIGITSQAFPVSPGAHVASANVTNSTFRWTNLSFSVPSGTTFTGVLEC